MASGLDLAKIVFVEAERHLPLGTVQLTQYDLPRHDHSFAVDRDRIDFCLTPRPCNTRARFRERWSLHRFEKVGAVFVMPRGEPMQFRTDGGPLRSMVCHLAPAKVQELLEERLDWSRHPEAGLDVTNQSVPVLLRRLAHELRAPGFASEAMAELLLGQVVIELARYNGEHRDCGKMSCLAAWRLRRIDERLADVCEPPSLTELANLCNMSVRQLTRAFRLARGCSIGEYLNHRRIEAAKRLLMRDDSIKSIALSMGFSSPSHFSQAFRRITGMTPRAFRAMAEELP